ncbi:glycosyltransferase family 87 protein [soil metagenome]
MTTLSFPIAAEADSPAPASVLRLAIVISLAQALWMFLAVNFIAPHYSDLLTGDIAYFFGAAKHVLAGDMPYRDFAFEYPPGALLAMLAPATLAGRSPDVTSYLWAMVFQNAVLAGAITVLLGRWSGLRSAITFNAPLAILAAFVPLRFDLLPALLTLLAVRYAIDRPARSGAILALGVCVKLYPAALLPILLLPHVTARRWRGAGRLVCAFAGMMLLVLVPFAIVSHNHVFDFLTFHRVRGLQVESIGGAAILLASKLHLTSATVATSFFSSNVTGAWSSGAIVAMQLLMLGLLGLQFVSVILKGRPKSTVAVIPRYSEGSRESRVVRISRFLGVPRNDGGYRERGRSRDFQELALVAATTLWIFIACNKVFSPQYVVWVLPLIALSKSRVAIVATVCVLTAAVFPFLYDSLKQIDWLPVLLVNARNGLVIAMIVYGLTTRPKNRIARV